MDGFTVMQIRVEGGVVDCRKWLVVVNVRWGIARMGGMRKEIDFVALLVKKRERNSIFRLWEKKYLWQKKKKGTLEFTRFEDTQN